LGVRIADLVQDVPAYDPALDDGGRRRRKRRVGQAST
jgi:hypothetical protein